MSCSIESAIQPKPRAPESAGVRPRTPRTDAELLFATAKGDLAAFRDLVYRHQDRVRHLAWNLLGDPHTADDVAQEVFLRVYTASGRYRAQGRFTTWLYRITLNLCHDQRRRSARFEALPLIDAPPQPDSPVDEPERAETVRRIRRAVKQLPWRQRTAVVLHRYEGLSHQQIAETTGWSRSAVESLLVRAYARLRRTLAPLIAENDQPDAHSS